MRAALALLLFLTPALAKDEDRPHTHNADGTVTYHDQGHNTHANPGAHPEHDRLEGARGGGEFFWYGERLRLKGWDIPEMYRSECSSPEKELGTRAVGRMNELMNSPGAQIIMFRNQHDTYGRNWASIIVRGKDIGEILQAEGLARPLAHPRKTWCRKDPSTGQIMDTPHGTVNDIESQKE